MSEGGPTIKRNDIWILDLGIEGQRKNMVVNGKVADGTFIPLPTEI